MYKKRHWTKEELDYLQEKWGTISISGIAKRLNRSINSVKVKAYKIGLGDPTLHYDGITVSQLLKTLGKSYSGIKSWIQNYDFPVKEKVFAKNMRVKVVSYEDFWEWAEQHKELINLSKMEPGLLGEEPEWAKIKRRADQLRSQKTKQAINWTLAEDQQLKQMVTLDGMTYPRLAEHFNRSEAAIKRRLFDLGVKFRPERLYNHNKYSRDEIKQLVTMAREGYSYETIAKKLGHHRSALGIRGKLERMNFDFKRREFREVETLWKLTR